MKKNNTRNTDHIWVTIPAHREANILETIKSLESCEINNLSLKISILINHSEESDQSVFHFHQKQFEELRIYAESSSLDIEILYEIFPAKHAGVGLARKTLMDRAANTFRSQNINGIILALDADCTVLPNYLSAVNEYFTKNKSNAASLYFEHPIGQNDEAIISYEFHLRYYIEMQRLILLPFAFHTVGSSMAVKSESYLAKGGMNRRKAGEDFYFMHKWIRDMECGEINNTCVLPSGRISDRVPFGTGRAVGKYHIEKELLTYNPAAFLALKPTLDHIFKGGTFHFEHAIIEDYFKKFSINERLKEISNNCTSSAAFKKRFYQNFDAFQLMKYLHFVREEYPDIPVLDAAQWYAAEVENRKFDSLLDSLERIRKKQKNGFKIV